MKKVGDINHDKSGIAIPYYLDKTDFVCDVLGERMTAPAANILIAQVKDKLEHWLVLEWFPIIKVSFTESDGWGNSKRTGLWVQSGRMWLSRSPAGCVLTCDWDTAPMHRKAAAIRLRDDAFKLTRLPLEEPIYLGGGDTWMDYTEAKWMSLKALEENIKAVAKNLKDIISSKRGNEVLELGSYPLLSADGKLLLSA